MNCRNQLKLILINLLFTQLLLAADKIDTVYVNHESGDDSQTNISETTPVRSFKRAFELVAPGGTVIIQKTVQPYTEKLIISQGGTPEKPLRVIATGAEINLGTDISKGPWKKDGDFDIYDLPLKRTLGGKGLYQLAALFVDNKPIHPFYHKLKQKTYVTYVDNTYMRVLFPDGVDPREGKHKIMLNADFRESAVSWAHGASNVIVDGLTVRHSGNDGFNLHGKSKNILLTNVTSLFNGDEGISAHGELEMKVTNSIIAYNGSAAGGIADVNDCITSYENCVSFNNFGAGFFFSARKHSVKNSIVFGNKRSFSVGKAKEFSKEGIYEYNSAGDLKAALDSLPKELKEISLKALNIIE